MKKEVLKIINILQPINLILLLIGIIYTLISAFSNVDWVSLGGTLRDWYWYEIFINYLTIAFIAIFITGEIIMFLSLNSKFKVYTLIYTLIEFLIIYLVWTFEPLMSLIVIFIFNFLKCLFRFKKVMSITN